MHGTGIKIKQPFIFIKIHLRVSICKDHHYATTVIYLCKAKIQCNFIHTVGSHTFYNNYYRVKLHIIGRTIINSRDSKPGTFDISEGK